MVHHQCSLESKQTFDSFGGNKTSARASPVCWDAERRQAIDHPVRICAADNDLGETRCAISQQTVTGLGWLEERDGDIARIEHDGPTVGFRCWTVIDNLPSEGAHESFSHRINSTHDEFDPD